jgi:hypothetical protein
VCGEESMPLHVAQYLVYRDGAMRVVEAVGGASDASRLAG